MRLFFLTTLLAGTLAMNAQNEEKAVLDRIYSDALTTPNAYYNLTELCTKAPGRLLGSPASETAISLLKNQLEKIHPDTVYLQKYRTPSWRCKAPAKAMILLRDGRKEPLNVVNLGLSPSTPSGGIAADIVEVHSMKELDSLGTEGINGKIVFFNRPMDNTKLNTFMAYGGAVDQRSGAGKAAQYGAVGAIVRSVATENDDFPHTGVGHFRAGEKGIANLAVSTNDANKLSRINRQYPGVKVWMESTTENLDTLESANLIAEIKGSVHPEKIILIGAHIDSWFNTPGAHDDGTGCAQVVDVLRIFKVLGLHPQNTIRMVLFMDEEMTQSGARTYAGFVGKEQKQHIACIETDAGGLLPLGFDLDGTDAMLQSLRKQTDKLTDYGVYQMIQGYGGEDVGFLKQYGFPLIGLLTNSQRYFEYHHSANDTVDKVSRREMQLGTASIASLVYLIDKNGL